MRKAAWLLVAFAALLFPRFLYALELKPFQVRNLSPTALARGVAIAESPRTLSAGHTSARLDFEIASNAVLSANGDESVVLDGETYVTTLGVRYGLSDRLQIGLDIPYIKHSEGFLDDFISDWHDFFGLPNGDRDSLPDDQLNYIYSKDGVESLRLSNDDGGLGDLRASLIWVFSSKEQAAYAMQLLLKTPTGDADKLTGSESWDVSLALLAQHVFPLSYGEGALWGGLAGNFVGDGEVMQDSAKDWIASAWLGAGWSPLDWLGLKLQLDTHSALYDSSLDELGDPAVILTMGGTLALSEKTLLDIGVGEDLAVGASPDITFHLGLQHSF